METEVDIFVEGDLPDLEIGSSSSKEHALVSWLAIFLVRLQARYYISDAAIQCLLKFLWVFLAVLGRFNDVAKGISEQLPRSLNGLKRFLGYSDKFQKLVVCSVCNSVYETNNCIERPGVSKLCAHQEFLKSRRCGNLLLKTVELASGRKMLYPLKVFCYQSIQERLTDLLAQPHFHGLCEHWRSGRDPNTLQDIYDGRIWKEFMTVSDKPFLSAPYNFALSLNVDWFQPYELTQCSVGVVYLTFLNLPRCIRYKREYTVLVGIIPARTYRAET